MQILIGWDISTSAIGICVRREGSDDEFHAIFPKGDTPLEKWRSASQQVEKFMDGIDHLVQISHIVEQRLGGFTGGLTTKQTLMALAAMNAVVSTVISHYGKITYILPVTAKALTKFKSKQLPNEDKKETVVRLARLACPAFPYKEKKLSGKPTKGKTYPWVNGVDDMADAWLLVEAYRALEGKASGQPEKARSGKGEARGTEGDVTSQGGVRIPVPGKARKRRVPKQASGEGEALGKSGG